MKGWLAFGLLFLLTTAAAQNRSLRELSRAQYVEKFAQYFFVWPVLKQKRTSFAFRPLNNHHQKLTYKPNVTYHAGAGVYVFGIGLQVVLALPENTNSTRQFGKSKALDLQANILGDNWAIDVFTQNYRGYYVEDATQHPAPGDALPQRDDVRTSNTGVTGIYFFDRYKFSIKSTYNYYERQLKSAGSFLISTNVNAFSLHADSAIYSHSYEATYGSAGNFQKVTYTTIAAAPGYAYNFVVLDRFFIGASLAIGPELNLFYYQKPGEASKKATGVSTYVDVRLSTGYNSERVFAGITYSGQSRNIHYEGLQFTSTNEVVKFAVGYRFKQFGILKKNVKDIFRAKSH